MTPQEQDMIQGLINRVGQTQLPEKDADAEQLLQQSLGRNPDALYILAQTVLVQKYALDQAQKQLTDLKSQLDQVRQHPPQTQQEHHTSFLGSLLGRNDPPPPPPPPPPSSQQPQYAPVPGYSPQQPGYGAPPSQFGMPAPGASQLGGQGSGQGGSFLRSAMQTATGVAAGALAFQGIESLMHGFGGGGGFGGGQGFGGFGGGAPREEIVNNYYGDSDRGSGDNNSLSPDIEDRRDDSFGNRLADADTGNADDTGSDYSSSDTDTSSFDSGSDDNTFDSGADDSSFDSGGSDDSSFS